MSDHEFEKKVQVKMDELKFRPSDAVWVGVEKKIREDKRRRRMLLWLPLFLLGLSAGGYMLLHETSRRASSSLTQQTVTNPQNSTPVTPSQKEIAPATDQPAKAVKEDTGQPAGTNTPTDPNTITATKKRDTEPGITASRPVGKWIKKTKRPVQEEGIAEADQRLQQQQTVLPAAQEMTEQETEKMLYGSLVAKDKPTWSINMSFPALPVPAEKASQPKQPIVRPVKKWQWGLQVNGGFSNVSENKFLDLHSVFGEQKSLVEDLASASAPQVSFNNNNYLSINPPLSRRSAIRTGYAYSLEGFVQRPLSRRFSLSLGVQYAYYSTQTTVGQFVNSARAVNIGMSNSQVVDQYYGGGRLVQNYTNRYHFIGIPVVAHYTLNRNRKTPFVLDGGLYVSKLLSTNALHYDGVNGIYYKDDNLFNKTQLGMTAGLNIGLLQSSRHPIWVGPSLRYSLTGLLKKDVSAGQYLWSTGLSVKMLLKK